MQPPKLIGAQLAAFPTETVWGLGALPTWEGGQALAAAKGAARKQKPAQVSCSKVETALSFCAAPEQARPFAALLPGPLSLIVRARSGIPKHLAPNGWVGLRVPAHPAAQALLSANGGVLLTTSLNRSGEPPARSEAEAKALALADVVFAGGELTGDQASSPASTGVASTIVRLEEGGWRIVREGRIDAGALSELVGTPPLLDPSSSS